jgi:hypothetical protein
MPPTAFTIKLGEGQQRVSIETLTQALENALDILRNVGNDFAPSDATVRWEVVAASMRSPLTLAFAPRVQGGHNGHIGAKLIGACVSGIRQVEKKAILPPHFNEAALNAVQRLHQVAAGDGAKVTVSSNGKRPITLTPKTVEHVKAIVAKARIYVDYGTIEGRLEILSVHQHDSFFLFETLTNKRIECIVADEEQFKEAISLLLKRTRVAVTGMIKYRNHEPKTLNVENIRRLKGSNELPQSKDMPPIDIADGMDPAEYVRRIRDAQ